MKGPRYIIGSPGNEIVLSEYCPSCGGDTDIKDCDECGGHGSVLTESGAELMAFVEEFSLKEDKKE